MGGAAAEALRGGAAWARTAEGAASAGCRGREPEERRWKAWRGTDSGRGERACAPGRQRDGADPGGGAATVGHEGGQARPGAQSGRGGESAGAGGPGGRPGAGRGGAGSVGEGAPAGGMRADATAHIPHSGPAGVGKFVPSKRQIEEMAAEFRARFGMGHELRVIHDEAANFLIKSAAGGAVSTTMLNTLEPPVTRAMFRYAKALAAEEYALLRDEPKIRWRKIKSARPSMDEWVMPPINYSGSITAHLNTVIRHTSAMAVNEHAADYVRFEHAKYSHLHKKAFPYVMRGVSLLTSAYIETADARHGAGVDAGDVTAGIKLDDIDRAIVGAAKRVLDEVHRQRRQESSINVKNLTSDLDVAFGRMKKPLGMG